MALCAYRNPEWLSAVYAMVDEVCIQDGALPPGTIGTLARLIDTADGDRSTDSFIPRAQAMLLTIHRLRASLTQTDCQAAAIRGELRQMCNDWIRSARFC
ncbi:MULTISPECIES: hypothetical protein [Sphingobium]|uniref:Uncharacterized protein n=1 Tax=Sphingobium chungbukense TaxID=56193 RepID=A0A0M3AMW1_9SPHN|nr:MULTISPECIES: hypothetical protein [Sphingobium]KKW91268.1 hypothetical protein YP76_17020 [Sphingobium chungbukense]PJG47574.1 hypothetical protein CAF53_04455 [Sphingobium sp. LB126]